MNRSILITLGILPVLFLAACGGAKEEAKKDEAPAAAPAAAVDEASAASITGKVMFAGDKPTMRAISMDATPACSRQHSTPPKSEEVVLNADGSLANVFVYVKAGLTAQSWPTPTTPAKLDQKTCVYTPHVLGVMVNQDIEITNSDPTNHNIHPLPKSNREWNESQPPGGDAKVKQFPREELAIPIKCNVHPWMRSYVHVMSHPYFSVTGSDGTFSIKNLPPGEYTLEAWHEKYPAQEVKVKVGPKEEGKADFTIKG